jgi:threonine dehydratase
MTDILLSLPLAVRAADVHAAAERIAGKVVRTPALRCDPLSRTLGADVFLKLECLQATGAYKERGAANKLAQLTEAERHAGVVAASSGNHAQAVARHAALLGVEATIVMPMNTPSTKVMRTAGWGATVVQEGEDFEGAYAGARRLEQERGLTFIHPFEDPAVMAGQGTVALELLADVADLDVLVVPVGGGGLIAGCAAVAAELKPDLEIIGVQIAGYSTAAQRLAGQSLKTGGATIADGSAVQDVGERTFRVIRDLVSDVLVVPEETVESAVAALAEGAKVVSEGAGALGTAALLTHRDRFRGKRVGTVVSGGNIDARILANTLLRSLLRDGRLMRLHMEIPDRPGVLADISTLIGAHGGNIIEVSHQRLFTTPTVRTAELDVTVEARDPDEAAVILRELEARYRVRRG